MTRYECDWCHKNILRQFMSEVRVENVYNEPVILHICRPCGRAKMPEWIQPLLSWTSEE